MKSKAFKSALSFLLSLALMASLAPLIIASASGGATSYSAYDSIIERAKGNTSQPWSAGAYNDGTFTPGKLFDEQATYGFLAFSRPDDEDGAHSGVRFYPTSATIAGWPDATPETWDRQFTIIAWDNVIALEFTAPAAGDLELTFATETNPDGWVFSEVANNITIYKNGAKILPSGADAFKTKTGYFMLSDGSIFPDGNSLAIGAVSQGDKIVFAVAAGADWTYRFVFQDITANLTPAGGGNASGGGASGGGTSSGGGTASGGDGGSNPRTGDDGLIALFAAAFIVASAGALILRKKQSERA